MIELKTFLAEISPANEAAARRAKAHWDNCAKPLGSLGLLEEMVIRIAALKETEKICLPKKTLAVFCADNGIVQQGVSQSGSEVTAHVTDNLAAGRTSACRMARVAGCRVVPVDMGVLDYPSTKGVLSRRVRNGTEDITQHPAMTREEALKAIETGISLAKELDADLLATGEMGIGNTTTASAVAAALLGVSPKEVTGRGAGLSDAGLTKKQAAIETALSLHRPDPKDPIDVLCKVGGLDLAAMCGMFLGGAAYRVPVLADGFISNVAALCAIQLCPNAKKAIFASHLSAEPAAKMLEEHLTLHPILQAGMRLGEGTGAVAIMPLLDMALAVYNESYTFEECGIDAYQPQQGETC